ncbi:mandelate racemase/muconate lactonizing enzyme family protein [Nonomuraea sp. B5E05]|uniref:mandelate racemase/muconate lactonizing enzyme family protein n=1 Tax=Nonomuraea sp. B5E05 TaxID=3153569 RepID=UPI0032615B73
MAVVPLGAARGGSGATSVQVLHVIIYDTDGASGTGFTYALTGGIEGSLAIADKLYGPAITGMNPLDWDRVWHELCAATHRLGRGVALPALSALDIAMWDLRARRAGLPLYRLLGAYRESVPIYGSGRATHQMSEDELVTGALTYLGEGYGAIKLRAGVHGIEQDIQRIAAVREAVGPDIRIMVDCNERLDLAEAQRFAHRLNELDVAWMEEPLPAGDVRGHALLAARSPVPIAVGEHLQGRFEVKQYLDQGACAILMPDAPLAGGVSEWLRISTLAEVSGIAISPHFLPELHVHLAAAAKPATYVEHFPLIDDLLLETVTVRGGMAVPPDLPGHGMRWNPDALDRFTAARS